MPGHVGVRCRTRERRTAQTKRRTRSSWARSDPYAPPTPAPVRRAVPPTSGLRAVSVPHLCSTEWERTAVLSGSSTEKGGRRV
eukprot:3685852-Rhodomonas_salina.1